MPKDEDEALLTLEFLLAHVRTKGLSHHAHAPGQVQDAKGLAKAFLNEYPDVEIPKNNGSQETD